MPFHPTHRPASSPPQLVIVSELFYPEETSTGRILTQIAAGLAKRSRVTAVCAQATYSQRGTRSPARETHEGVEIHRCWSTTFDKDKLLLRLLNAATLCLSVFCKLLFVLRPADRVLVVTTPPVLPLVTAAACRLRGIPWTLLVHDVYPDVAVAAGLLRPGSIGQRLGEKLMSQLLRLCESIIVLGRDMRELISRKLPAHCRVPIHIIPNWAETEYVYPDPEAGRALLHDSGLNEKLVIQYSGNMGRSHNIEDVVAAAEVLKDHPLLHFVFIGNGAKRKWLDETVNRRFLRNVTVSDYLPRNRLNAGLNACDIAIVGFVSGMAGVSVPCRTYNILAAGKPIVAICDPQSELALVIQEERIGWVVQPGDLGSLTKILAELPQLRSELAAMGRRARDAAERSYRFDSVVALYEDWLGLPVLPSHQYHKAA